MADLRASTTAPATTAPATTAPATTGRTTPKLLDQVRQALRLRHFSVRTEESYVAWIRRYIRFHALRHPRELDASDVTRFLTMLAEAKRLSASSQTQALSALLFLYRDVLHRRLESIEPIPRAKQPVRLPVVLDRDEVRQILMRLVGAPRIAALLMYGSGLRLLETLELRVKDLDFRMGEIIVRRGTVGTGECRKMVETGAVLALRMGSRRRTFHRGVMGSVG
jgi:integrase